MENSVVQRLVRQPTETTFEQIHLGRRVRREVHLESGVSSQPVRDGGALVGCIVFQDRVHIQPGR